jgi:hypothetical protein
MAKLVGAFKGKDPKEVAIAANFTNYVTSNINCNCTIILGTLCTPISLGQAITSILIAGMFTVISFDCLNL